MRLREIIYGEINADEVDSKMKKSLDNSFLMNYNVFVLKNNAHPKRKKGIVMAL